jgi:hypothetical protein
MKGSKRILINRESIKLDKIQKRKAAEAVVDAALLREWARMGPGVSQEDRESWVQALIEKPELTPKLFLRKP